ncbi:MAG: dTMP kinase [Victivallales bacterium]|nr:dTMP kinase [Victivallales bacterium]MBT7304239.1 dTMP kinase [Victivallales bacterium]
MRQVPTEPGLLLTFEGPEGAGKSTQISLLADVLRQRDRNVLTTREPGGTPLGEELRRLIKHFGGPDSVSDEAELLMFGASRAQLMSHVIQPHLDAGGVVLCDRFADSTTVYQGLARGLDAGFIERLHEFTLGHRWPDLTILLDVTVDTGFARVHSRQDDGPVDRIEAESRQFHEAVREGFLTLAKRHPERFFVTSGEGDPAAIHQTILEALDHALG